MIERRFVHGTLRLVQGDITKQPADAIVNAANSSLLGGGGVDGAIHSAGGPTILEECKRIRARQGGCPTGEAVHTTAGDLPARHVIHAVGPVWQGGDHDEDSLLASCYSNSLEIADELGLATIAFPSISTGAFRFPIDRAARIALDTVMLGLLDRLAETAIFVLFDARDLDVYHCALEALPEKP